jgi:hypothetical protein
VSAAVESWQRIGGSTMMTWCSAPHNFRTGSEIVS